MKEEGSLEEAQGLPETLATSSGPLYVSSIPLGDTYQMGKLQVRLGKVDPRCCSVDQLYPTLCNPIDCRKTRFPVLHSLLGFSQIYVHWVGDVIQLSHPLLHPSLFAFNLSQHQGLFQWVSSLHQVAKVLEFQFQHQSFQWIFRTDWLDLLTVQGLSRDPSWASIMKRDD